MGIYHLTAAVTNVNYQQKTKMTPSYLATTKLPIGGSGNFQVEWEMYLQIVPLPVTSTSGPVLNHQTTNKIHPEKLTAFEPTKIGGLGRCFSFSFRGLFLGEPAVRFWGCSWGIYFEGTELPTTTPKFSQRAPSFQKISENTRSSPPSEPPKKSKEVSWATKRTRPDTLHEILLV